MAAAINDDREQQFETRLYKGTKSPLRAHNLTTCVRAFAGGAGKTREKKKFN